jgi:hypothetical protein
MISKRYLSMEYYIFFRPNIQVDALRWDACNLPLRDSCVDVFITDLVGIISV